MHRYTISILAIPDYWMTFYIFGFCQHKECRVLFAPEKKFADYNYLHCCVLRISKGEQSRLIIIDTNDPSDDHLQHPLHFDHVFLSQKLKSVDYPESGKVHALPPHFPIRSFYIFSLMGRHFFSRKNVKENLRQLAIVATRLKPKKLLNANRKSSFSPRYFFYQRSLWKNEPETNLLGAVALEQFSKKGYIVEGGFYRADEFRSGSSMIDKWVSKKQYGTSTYVKKMAASVYCFNSPAVKGACSWRMGEYLALNKVIISTPFAVEMPDCIRFIEMPNDADTLAEKIDALPDNPYANGHYDNADCWDTTISPEAQINWILKTIF